MSRQVSRRRFLALQLTGSGLLISARLLPGLVPALVQAQGESAGATQLEPNLFVQLHRDGSVTITCHRSEMGQQVRTSMAQLVADELEVPWQAVRVAQANGDPAYGDQNTDGSRSVRRNFTRLRQAGASVRQLLRKAAALSWQVSEDECDAEQGVVFHRSSGRQLAYADLIDTAADLALPDPTKVALKSRDQWRYIGKAIASVDLEAVLHGDGIFGMDVQLPDMLVAAIARPPVLYGQVASLDDEAARKVGGVVDVVQLDPLTAPPLFKPLGGVAVLARNTWAAFEGCKRLQIRWRDGINASYQSEELRETLRQASRRPGEVAGNQGDVDDALERAATLVEAQYTAPHLAHASMEPPVASARVTANSAEVWACTQHPQAARASVAQALGLAEDRVTVHVTLLGGGFGRKSKADFCVEAALLARAAGRPVKVVWSREDDIRHDYYHALSVQHLQAGLDTEGRAVALLHRTLFPTITSTFDAGADLPSDMELSMGALDNPFELANFRLERGRAPAQVRIGWLRSVINIFHAFALQSFADELAHAAERDPKDYLLQLIGEPRQLQFNDVNARYANYDESIDAYPYDTGRLSQVVRIAAERADWDAKRRQGRALGIAAHGSFLSYVATVVEVEVGDDGSWRIPQVYTVIDAGTVVNIEHVRAQCEGGAVFGLSCALGAITVSDGRVQESNFHDYRVARMPQAPASIDVHIVPSTAAPAGVGEPPTPPMIPALCNALFAATGKRIRDLPIPLRV